MKNLKPYKRFLNRIEVKEKFKENLTHDLICFEDWVFNGICDPEEMEDFIIWLNQLSEKEILKYIEKDSSIFSAITDQTKELCEFAIKCNPYNLVHIRSQTVDLCLKSLEVDNYCHNFVRIVPNPDHEKTIQNLLEKKAVLEAFK